MTRDGNDLGGSAKAVPFTPVHSRPSGGRKTKVAPHTATIILSADEAAAPLQPPVVVSSLTGSPRPLILEPAAQSPSFDPPLDSSRSKASDDTHNTVEAAIVINGVLSQLKTLNTELETSGPVKPTTKEKLASTIAEIQSAHDAFNNTDKADAAVINTKSSIAAHKALAAEPIPDTPPIDTKTKGALLIGYLNTLAGKLSDPTDAIKYLKETDPAGHTTPDHTQARDSFSEVMSLLLKTEKKEDFQVLLEAARDIHSCILPDQHITVLNDIAGSHKLELSETPSIAELATKMRAKIIAGLETELPRLQAERTTATEHRDSLLTDLPRKIGEATTLIDETRAEIGADKTTGLSVASTSADVPVISVASSPRSVFGPDAEDSTTLRTPLSSSVRPIKPVIPKLNLTPITGTRLPSIAGSSEPHTPDTSPGALSSSRSAASDASPRTPRMDPPPIATSNLSHFVEADPIEALKAKLKEIDETKPTATTPFKAEKLVAALLFKHPEFQSDLASKEPSKQHAAIEYVIGEINKGRSATATTLPTPTTEKEANETFTKFWKVLVDADAKQLKELLPAAREAFEAIPLDKREIFVKQVIHDETKFNLQEHGLTANSSLDDLLKAKVNDQIVEKMEEKHRAAALLRVKGAGPSAPLASPVTSSSTGTGASTGADPDPRAAAKAKARAEEDEKAAKENRDHDLANSIQSGTTKMFCILAMILAAIFAPPGVVLPVAMGLGMIGVATSVALDKKRGNDNKDKPASTLANIGKALIGLTGTALQKTWQLPGVLAKGVYGASALLPENLPLAGKGLAAAGLAIVGVAATAVSLAITKPVRLAATIVTGLAAALVNLGCGIAKLFGAKNVGGPGSFQERINNAFLTCGKGVVSVNNGIGFDNENVRTKFKEFWDKETKPMFATLPTYGFKDPAFNKAYGEQLKAFGDTSLMKTVMAWGTNPKKDDTTPPPTPVSGPSSTTASDPYSGSARGGASTVVDDGSARSGAVTVIDGEHATSSITTRVAGYDATVTGRSTGHADAATIAAATAAAAAMGSARSSVDSSSSLLPSARPSPGSKTPTV